ncbi:Nucleolar protein 10like [Caligus rogercresseyi]|uniref:Nucleolar protein 10 n=1 Tax=Caligus rogercresseyi TaxID=217165 RepID=A0A7T8JWM7_CALRO|nr:Nucleolar protein 10like [Caligus rogercresseyi]
MNVVRSNDVPIYDLTVGKSLPEWLDERKRRTLIKKNEHLRRRIELIQEFDMPGVSDSIRISPDGEYIVATGTYKPRVKAYELRQLGLKFERCFDAEVRAFRMLGNDYSKMIFLQADRYIEIHSQGGKYYRLRIPKFGRDLEYHPGNCDVYFAGDGPSVTRLNLEQGRFLNPLTDESDYSTSNDSIKINPVHQLIMVGSNDGKIRAWDHRVRKVVGSLDIGSAVGISSLAFRHNDALNLAAGTSDGRILLYDVRSSKPIFVKDHMYERPIKKVKFHTTLDQVLSLDEKVLKIWDRVSGKPYTAIEGSTSLNDFDVFPGSGLIVIANEQPKMQVHYIPNLGPAPKWCGFLDNITEELEESESTELYDDYNSLSLEHLVGTPLLRAHMHGYFIDVRLYRKAKALAKPYTIDKFIKDKVKTTLDEQAEKRVKIKSHLPPVNKDLFLKLTDKEENKELKKSKKGKVSKEEESLLKDDRFSSLFKDPRFAVDTSEETYRLLNPVVSKLDDSKKKKLENKYQVVDEDSPSGSEKSDLDSSSDEEEGQVWAEEVRKEHKKIQIEKVETQRREKAEKLAAKLSKISEAAERLNRPKFYEVKDAAQGSRGKSKHKSLEERIKGEAAPRSSHRDGHEMSFEASKSFSQIRREKEMKEHREERQAVRRSASHLKKKRIAPKFWMGKRIV